MVHQSPAGGLTKREYFAALAMQALMQHVNLSVQAKKEFSDWDITVCEDAVSIADRLIAELERELTHPQPEGRP
jgi:hypothetical protein